MKTYASLLQTIGCTDVQVSIFEALWKYGSKSAGTLAKLVGVERTHVYKMLDQMVGRGIVAKSKLRGATSFSIPSDTVLDQYFAMQQSRIDHEKAKIPKAYEELEELSTRTDGHTPLYRIWEGHDGMEQMFHEAIGQLLGSDLQVIKIIALSTLENSVTTSLTLSDYAGPLFTYCDTHDITIESTVGTGVMIPEQLMRFTDYKELASLPAGQSSLYVIVIGTHTYFAVFKEIPVGFKRDLVELADLFHFFTKVIEK